MLKHTPFNGDNTSDAPYYAYYKDSNETYKISWVYHVNSPAYLRDKTIINFETFIKDNMNTEQFPKDDFGIIVENNNGKEIIDYLVSKGFKNIYHFLGTRHNNRVYHVYDKLICNTLTSKTYTLQQLKDLENNMENKEIIDYEILPEFLNSIELLCGIKLRGVGIHNFRPDSQVYRILNKNKVLDIWATPVYKSKEVVIKMGENFNLTVKDGIVWHEKEDITNYVTGVHAWYMSSGALQTKKINSYDFIVKDIILSKTGCKSTESSINSWLLVFDELQKQK